MKQRRGFSLVEVAISTTVLATAALLLSAALSAANSQKASARRLALAKSLVVRQLELFQQRISESQVGVTHAGLGSAPNASLRLDALRGSGRVYRIASDGVNVYSPHAFCYRNQNNLPVSGGTSFNVPVGSTYHVMFPSSPAVRANATSVPNPPGSMFQDEIDRIRDERLTVELHVASCQTDGNRDNPTGNDPLPASMQNPDLLIAQVIVRDTDSTNELFTLSRMFRVQNRFLFVPEGQF